MDFMFSIEEKWFLCSFAVFPRYCLPFSLFSWLCAWKGISHLCSPSLFLRLFSLSIAIATIITSMVFFQFFFDSLSFSLFFLFNFRCHFFSIPFTSLVIPLRLPHAPCFVLCGLFSILMSLQMKVIYVTRCCVAHCLYTLQCMCLSHSKHKVNGKWMNNEPGSWNFFSVERFLCLLFPTTIFPLWRLLQCTTCMRDAIKWWFAGEGTQNRDKININIGNEYDGDGTSWHSALSRELSLAICVCRRCWAV